MSDGKRPGGLTALAVLNFVFGGIGALALLAVFALLGTLDHASGGESTRVMVKSEGLVWVNLLLGIVVVALLIASGVGYLGQKRVLGRTLGTVYALVALANTAIGLTLQPFGIPTIIGLVYPVLTLVLVNTTFKEDLVN